MYQLTGFLKQPCGIGTVTDTGIEVQWVGRLLVVPQLPGGRAELHTQVFQTAVLLIGKGGMLPLFGGLWEVS